MKKWLLILLAFLPVLSCVGQKDDPAPELRLVADLTTLNVTEGERATFTVLLGAEDVTAYATIHNVTDGTDLEGSVFAPAEAGEWTFVAAVDGQESESVTDTALVIAEEGKAFFRRSLVLDFTGTWCVNCPKMDAAIEAAMEERPGRVVPVSVHCLSIDPMYVKPLSDNLVKQFGVNAYPSAVVDLDPESLITTSSPVPTSSYASRQRLVPFRWSAEVITATKVKDGQWKIAVENSKGKKSYRYFDTEAIERSQNRRRMETIPWEERKKRNNVEATIFQYCLHTRNNKTRYRGLFKHKMQAIARCAWINVRRLLLFDLKMALQRA